MTPARTEEEVRAAKLLTMGSELGELHYLLWRDVSWLHVQWQEFRELFGTSKARTDLMNRTAPFFFANLQDVLWHDILLHLSRLTDPPATRGQHNLTLRRLPSLLTPELRQAVNQALDQVQSSTAFARDWRDRRLAHRDLDHARRPEASPLAPGSRASVTTALEAISRVMNLVEAHYEDSTFTYAVPAVSPQGALALLRYLDSGLELEEIREREHKPWRPRFL